MFSFLLGDKTPWTGISEDEFDADFEKKMKDNGGTEVKEEEKYARG
jgi:hypothetical protein